MESYKIIGEALYPVESDKYGIKMILNNPFQYALIAQRYPLNNLRHIHGRHLLYIPKSGDHSSFHLSPIALAMNPQLYNFKANFDSL